MKTILLLFLFTAKTVVAAESNHLTPEFLFQQAKKIKTEEERQVLFEKVFASKNIENVKAMRQLPRLCLGFSLFDYLEKQEDSHFKDQIMIMIMNEPWRNDIESTVEGSSGMGPELYFIKYLEKRAPELNLHTGPGKERGRKCATRQNR
jgi:hypothetical protein